MCRSTTSWVCEHWEGVSTSAHSCTSSAKNSAWHREVLKYLWNGKRKPTALFPRKVSTHIYIDILYIFSESLCFYLRLRPSFCSILPTDRPTLIDPNAYFIAILLEGQLTFLVKVQIISILDFVGHTVFLENYSGLSL